MPIPPIPEPNHASAVARAGTERDPPSSAAIGFNATTAIHGAPNETPRMTSDRLAVIHEALVSMLVIMFLRLSSGNRTRIAATRQGRIGLARNSAPLRHDAERLLEARRIAGPDLRIEHARDALAVGGGERLFGGDAPHVAARLARHAGGMRRRNHIIHLQQRMIERRGL